MATGAREVEVRVGEGSVAIRKPGRSSPWVANILGAEAGADGRPQRLWLDRLVHAPGEHWSGEWEVSGAISSVLTRCRAATADDPGEGGA